MHELIVKKLIARNGARELVDSSLEEKQRFIVERQRPDFNDDTILCIKFLEADNETMEYAEESSWFINPVYVNGFTMFNHINVHDEDSLDTGICCCSYVDEGEFSNVEDVDDEVAMEFASTFGYSPNESYGPKMASEFLPEILVLQPQFPKVCMFSQYQSFYAELLRYNLTACSPEQKLELFVKYLRSKKYR